MKKNKEEKYELFKEKVLSTVKQYYGEEYDVSIHPIQKNNGLILYGLNILKCDTHVCPTIYLEDFFSRYENGCAFSTVFKEIIDIYEKYKDPDFLDLDFFSDYEKVKKMISVKIINAEYNKELLQDVPHKMIEDLAIVAIVQISNSDNHIGSVLVHNNHICMWGVRASKLIDEAIENSARMQTVMFKRLAEVIMDMYDDPFSSEEEETGDNFEEEFGFDEDAPSMYVLTNKAQMFGAAVMTYPGLLDKIGDKLECNYYIIPSSIHELIILPDNITGHISNINEMISSINSEMLSKEEVLSNHAYHYDINSKNLSSVVNEIMAVN